MKKTFKIINVVGARPNFMKIAPIMEELNRWQNATPILVHTGQHYDSSMSRTFFRSLALPKPDIYLGVGGGTHAEQTARIMTGFEKVCFREKPDLVLVVGDVNSTMACSIVAAKSCIPIAHVEAGLRSFDRTMPEEINRIITDSLADLLFTTCEDANRNLKKEGIPGKKIHFVGNVMIDTLLKFRDKAKSKAKTGLAGKNYALLTLHRPGNVDDKAALKNILDALRKVSKEIPIIFPAHPRTQKRIKSFGLMKYFTGDSIRLMPPLSYLDFLELMTHARFVLTDSGGIQEETTILSIPCLTIRENTERPVTIREGTNVLVGSDRNKIIKESMKILDGKGKTGRIPRLWDGQTAGRIVRILKNRFKTDPKTAH